MSRPSGDQLLNLVDGLDATSRAGCGAVERGGGTGEVQLAWQRPALQQSVNKSGVEYIPGARGIQRLHTKGGRVVESRTIPCQNAFTTQGGGGEATAVSYSNCCQ